jgi:hypothetical protein
LVHRVCIIHDAGMGETLIIAILERAANRTDTRHKQIT